LKRLRGAQRRRGALPARAFVVSYRWTKSDSQDVQQKK